MTEQQLMILEVSKLPGYQYLIEMFEAELNRQTEFLAEVQDAVEAIKTLTYWQYLKHTINILKNTPEELEETLEVEGNRAMYETLGRISFPPQPQIQREKQTQNPYLNFEDIDFQRFS